MIGNDILLPRRARLVLLDEPIRLRAPPLAGVGRRGSREPRHHLVPPGNLPSQIPIGRHAADRDTEQEAHHVDPAPIPALRIKLPPLPWRSAPAPLGRPPAC